MLRSVENDAEYAFLKGTWQITPDDRLTATYFSDPTDISGSALATTLNNRDRARTQGGDKYKIDYSRTFGDLLLNAYYFSHEGELSDVSANQSVRDNVGFRNNASSTLARRRRAETVRISKRTATVTSMASTPNTISTRTSAHTPSRAATSGLTTAIPRMELFRAT